MPDGGFFDPASLCTMVQRSVTDGGGAPRGGGGTGTGGGGGVTGGTGAAPSAGAGSTAGGGTAGVGNVLPWLYPTADFKNFDKGPGNGDAAGVGAVALPAIGASAVILQFKVPNGRCGKITQMGIDFVTSPSPATPAIYLQGSLPAPLTFNLTTNGKPFQDYGFFQFSPGAVSAPTPINGVMLFENNLIVLSVTNNTVVVTAGEQWLAARIMGYYFSKNLMPKIMGMQ